MIFRDVVPGNVYDDDDTLLVIEPLDHLWVWGNVFESDLDLVKLGQSWEIQFPFQTERLHGKVEYISNNVDRRHACRPGAHLDRQQGRPDQVRHARARVPGDSRPAPTAR